MTLPDWQMPPRRRPRTLWSDLAGLWRRFRGAPFGVQFLIGAIAVVAAIALLSIPFRSGPDTKVAARSSTTVRRTTLVPTTTLPPLPAGEDKTVKTVIDGDSLELDDATKIRLIGIDAPDVETNSCFSAEATSHLKDLLPPGRTVRVVYDVGRTDRFGRTLAYIYRLPDGLFINEAMAKDGFATQLTTPPNTVHADEFGRAVSDAQNARRGLWQTCPTTTTAGRTAATAVATTTTTEPPATSPPTSAAPPTTAFRAPGTVQEGQICLPAGARGTLRDGGEAVCDAGPQGFLVWRRA